MRRPRGAAVVLRGDARHLPLPDRSVDLIVTSPPFLNQRSYTDGGAHYDGQIGSGTRDQFLADLWDVTAEMVRVLKPSGSIFVELGDSYTDKCLNDTPHRYSIGCTDRLGLIKRAEIIWHHTSGTPDSAADRAGRAHSTVFHFTRSARYYSAVDDIREAYAPAPKGKHDTGSVNARKAMMVVAAGDSRAQRNDMLGTRPAPNPLGKLPGSVWGIPVQPLIVPAHLGIEHHAPFPCELPRRIILGWSPPGGCVVDPFGGTGTTALVASVLGRLSITFDRSGDYCRLAQWRTRDPGERARALGVPKPPPVPDGQDSLFDLETS